MTFDSFKEYCEYTIEKYEKEIGESEYSEEVDIPGESEKKEAIDLEELIDGTFGPSRTFNLAVLKEQARLAHQSLDIIEKEGEEYAMKWAKVKIRDLVIDQALRMDNQVRSLLKDERVTIYAGADFLDVNLNVDGWTSIDIHHDKLLGKWIDGEVDVEKQNSDYEVTIPEPERA